MTRVGCGLRAQLVHRWSNSAGDLAHRVSRVQREPAKRRYYDRDHGNDDFRPARSHRAHSRRKPRATSRRAAPRGDTRPTD